MIDFTVQIAGQVFAVSAMFESTKAYCTKYLCDGAARYDVKITPEDLQFESEASLREDAAEGKPPRSYSEPHLETLALQRKIAACLFAHNILLFHGSAVAVDGAAYLFIAKSGTGKSTHSALWRQLLGERAVMVNDDKPFLEILEDRVIVHGSPWNGAHKQGNNISVPLKAICILQRGEVNKIESISSKDSIYMLLQQSSKPKSSALLGKYMDLLDTLSRSTAFYRLSCNTDIEAAQVAYNAMSK